MGAIVLARRPSRAASPELLARLQQRAVSFAVEHRLVHGSEEIGVFDQQGLGRLIGHMFPSVAPDEAEPVVDWLVVFCLLDDYLESCVGHWQIAMTLLAELEAIRYRGKGCIDNLPWQPPYWQSLRFAFAAVLDRLQRRNQFGREVVALLDAFKQEAAARDAHDVEIGSYFERRTLTVGIRPLVAALGWAVPEAALNAAARSIGFENDLFTAERERRAGENQNAVLIAGEAFTVEQHNDLIEYLAHVADPRLDDLVGGHLTWSAETDRYDLTSVATTDPRSAAVSEG
jgi:hypothetical protein